MSQPALLVPVPVNKSVRLPNVESQPHERQHVYSMGFLDGRFIVVMLNIEGGVNVSTKI